MATTKRTKANLGKLGPGPAEGPFYKGFVRCAASGHACAGRWWKGRSMDRMRYRRSSETRVQRMSLQGSVIL